MNLPLSDTSFSNPDNSLNIGASYLRDMDADSSVISSYRLQRHGVLRQAAGLGLLLRGLRQPPGLGRHGERAGRWAALARRPFMLTLSGRKTILSTAVGGRQDGCPMPTFSKQSILSELVDNDRTTDPSESRSEDKQ
jgi:hypothetical protein